MSRWKKGKLPSAAVVEHIGKIIAADGTAKNILGEFNHQVSIHGSFFQSFKIAFHVVVTAVMASLVGRIVSFSLMHCHRTKCTKCGS